MKIIVALLMDVQNTIECGLFMHSAEIGVTARYDVLTPSATLANRLAIQFETTLI